MNEDPIFAKIESASKRLNTKSDKVGEYLSHVESRLAAAGVGIEVVGDTFSSKPYVVATGDLDDRMEQGSKDESVAYARCGGKWRLAVRTSDVRPDTSYPGAWETIDWADQPLLDSDRETRILAAPHIPDLLQKIAEALENKTNAIESVLEKGKTLKR